MSSTRRPVSGALRARASWVLADSALSSLTNAGLTIGLARLVSSGEYGAFALSFTLYSLVQSVSMAVNNQVVVIGFAGSTGPEQHRALASASAGSTVVGTGAGLTMIVVGFALGGHSGLALVAMGAIMPALMLQDHWRLAFVAIGEPRRAFLLDLAWTVIWAGLFLVLDRFGARSAAVYIVVWGVGALLSALWGQWLSRAGIALRSAGPWFAGHTSISLPSLANTFATIGAAQLAFILISVLGSVQDLGALRGAQTLLGPLNIVGFAIFGFAMPEIVRRDLHLRGLLMSSLAISGFLVAVTAAWGGLLLLLPGSVGRELLGDTWSTARVTLPGLVLFAVCAGVTAGPSAVLRSLNRVRSAAMLSALSGILVLIGTSVGVLLDAARGASYGFAFAGLISIVPTWALLVHDARLGRRRVVPAA